VIILPPEIGYCLLAFLYKEKVKLSKQYIALLACLLNHSLVLLCCFTALVKQASKASKAVML
jgi:hypothetical protein